MQRVDLSNVELDGARLDDAVLGWTIFSDAGLRNITGLETCQHTGPSTVDHRTLARNPHLSDRFLRDCGHSDLDIEAYHLKNPNLSTNQVDAILYRMHDLRVGRAIFYHSCFVSYSSKDDTFSQKLYDDLQDAGIRCWFAPEDMKIGSKIRYAIDQAIHLQEKLLLILSESSVKSQWVEQEVEKALERERKEDQLVLFPVRLDGAVFDVAAGWASFLKNTRAIGDFTDWDDDDKYNAAFQRLLRDLRTGK